MKKYILTILSFGALIFAFSCNNTPAKDQLLGTWVFEKYMTGGTVTQEADPKEKFELVFTEKGMVYSLEITTAATDTVQAASYELSKDGRSFVIRNKETSKEDIINIKELSSSVLITQEQTSESISVFKRK